MKLFMTAFLVFLITTGLSFAQMSKELPDTVKMPTEDPPESREGPVNIEMPPEDSSESVKAEMPAEDSLKIGGPETAISDKPIQVKDLKRRQARPKKEILMPIEDPEEPKNPPKPKKIK